MYKTYCNNCGCYVPEEANECLCCHNLVRQKRGKEINYNLPAYYGSAHAGNQKGLIDECHKELTNFIMTFKNPNSEGRQEAVLSAMPGTFEEISERTGMSIYGVQGTITELRRDGRVKLLFTDNHGHHFMRAEGI